MRSTFAVTAVLTAGAAAAPFVGQRDVVTETNIAYVTDIVTITAGAAPVESSPSVQAPASSSLQQSQHWGHHWHPWSSASSSTSVQEEQPSSTSVASTSTATPTSSTTESWSSTAEPTTASSTAAPSSSVAPSSASSSSVASSASSASGSDPTSYSDIVVYHHNLHRANHSATDIQFNQSLADTAMKIAQTCQYKHQMDVDNGGYGQNIAAGVPADNVSAVITDLFYNGEVGWYADLYGQAQPDQTNFEKYGHFTQIVWKDTVSVGCASYDCSSQGLSPFQGENIEPTFTVCNYYPPGNYANEYADNVGEPLNHDTVEWNDGGFQVKSTAASQQ